VPGQGGNSPEDDARPGEYYFMRGVEAVRAKDFDHAVKMYEAAASWGYKNAQYNLAVMYARGEGIAQDLPRAMAWAALAAERNDKQYVQARELIYASLDKAQWDQANVIWRDLKNEYADEVALARAKARWVDVRQGMTGSHVGSIGHLQIGGGVPGAPSVAAGGARGDPSPGNSTINTPKVGGFMPADVAGAFTVEGTSAYKSLRETDNPYDPKLSPAIGTATVGTPVESDTARNKPHEDAASQH
jgi:Sel1 repeat-containing protein